MNHADIINGLFELAGGFAIWLSIAKLYREKMVRGVSFYHVGFFGVWGLWNLYFYPYYGAMFSFWAGAFLFTSNFIYGMMLLYYIKKESNETGTKDSEESSV